MVKADCHCHTSYSDGTLCVDDLLKLAKERQLTGLSITDHDTVQAYPEAIPLAKYLEIELIPGIEISAELEKVSIHVLGYAFDLQHPELHSFCEKLQKERYSRNEQILARLTHYKMPISMEELYSTYQDKTVGRPHIAAMMVRKGYVGSVRKAFTFYLGDQKKCYVPGFHISVEEAIDLVHKIGGFAVLAHPHYIQPKKLISMLSSMPFDGIEAYYGQLTPKQEKPWVELAKKKNWMITGGSDFHGGSKYLHPLGCSFTPVETFEVFKKRANSRNVSH